MTAGLEDYTPPPRTVGSLCADDVGKMVSIDGEKPRLLDSVTHEAGGTSVLREWVGPSWHPHDTPCEVTP